MSARRCSVPLCFGTVRSISRNQRSRSSVSRAFRNSASAALYSGVRLAGTIAPRRHSINPALARATRTGCGTPPKIDPRMTGTPLSFHERQLELLASILPVFEPPQLVVGGGPLRSGADDPTQRAVLTKDRSSHGLELDRTSRVPVTQLSTGTAPEAARGPIPGRSTHRGCGATARRRREHTSRRHS